MKKTVEEVQKENKKLKEIIESTKGDLSMVKQIKNKVAELENDIDKQEQYSKRWNLLFDSIPENVNENCSNLVIGLCKQLDVTVELEEIQIAHRVGN